LAPSNQNLSFKRNIILKFVFFGSNKSRKEGDDCPEEPDSDRGGAAEGRVGRPDAELLVLAAVAAVGQVFRTAIARRVLESVLIN
jgi:hypothetical protein